MQEVSPENCLLNVNSQAYRSASEESARAHLHTVCSHTGPRARLLLISVLVDGDCHMGHQHQSIYL